MAMYRSREKAIRDWNDSINSARREGQITELIELVRYDPLDVQKAAERAGMTMKEFQKRMQEENVDKN